MTKLPRSSLMLLGLGLWLAALAISQHNVGGAIFCVVFTAIFVTVLEFRMRRRSRR